MWLTLQPRPWAVDLFSGAGGLSLGLEQAGFSVVASADSDPLSTETHAANIQGLTWNGDLANPSDFIHQLDAWGIDSVDLLAGGAPVPAVLQGWHLKDWEPGEDRQPRGFRRKGRPLAEFLLHC